MIKNFVFLLMATLFAISCNNPKNESTQATAPEVIKSVEFTVEGMTCTGCENTIQKSVGSIKGVKTVKADHIAGNTIITYDSTSVSLDAMKQAIVDKGYEITATNQN